MLQTSRRISLAAGALALLVNLGCYAYQPAVGTPRAVGDKVRVELTPDGVTDLTRYLGPRIGTVEGQVTDVGGDGTITVAIGTVTTLQGIAQPFAGDTPVPIPAPDIGSVTVRRFNRQRTTVAVVGIGLALALIAVAALRSGGVSGLPSAGGTTPPAR